MNTILKLLKYILDIKSLSGTTGKNLFKTKTFWGLVISGILVTVGASYMDWHLTETEIAGYYLVIGSILRLITKVPAGFIDVQSK